LQPPNGKRRVRNIDLFLPGLVDQQQSSAWDWFGHKRAFRDKAVSLLWLIVQRLIAALPVEKPHFPTQSDVKMLQLWRLVARSRTTGPMLRKLPQARRRRR
jgi:hypothetical protein